LSGTVQDINTAKDKEGIVMSQEETRHGLEDGDYVTFTEIKGMTELNGCEPRKIKVLGKKKRSLIFSMAYSQQDPIPSALAIRLPSIITKLEVFSPK
jgi:ubiquitin-activating enzyme E1